MSGLSKFTNKMSQITMTTQITSSSLTPVILRIVMIGSDSAPRKESDCPCGGGGGNVTRDDSSRSDSDASGGGEGKKVGLKIK